MTTKNNKTTTAGEKSTPAVETEKQNKPIIPKDIDIHQYVTVKNGFQGRLVYVSKKSGEPFIWDEFGSEQEMELQELRNAKNTAKRFFIDNWFMFDEDWIIDYLGVRQYYAHAVKIEDFDKIFNQTPTEISKTISTMSNGQKKSVVYRAKQLIADGGIDSNRVIKALEEATGAELIER